MAPNLILAIDGCDPAALAASATPNLDALGRAGFRATGFTAVMPTVTNVNMVSLATGEFPEVHGIAANYWRDPATGREEALEGPEALRAGALWERQQKPSSAVLVVKEKLLRLIGKGAGYAASAERPDDRLVAALGRPPGVYTAEINLWLLDACRHVLATIRPDLLFAATTDWIFHAYGPDRPESRAFLAALDARLGRILDEFPDLDVLVTADHGMNDKRLALDPTRLLAAAGVAGRAIPIIRDRYVVHHKNLGGSAYVHLDRADDRDRAARLLASATGVEAVLTRDQAARRFRLPADRIGDLMLLADRDTVFGDLESIEEKIELRSHGSLHELGVPVLASRPLAGDDLCRSHVAAIRAFAAPLRS